MAKVLIVEDEDVLRLTFDRFLTDAGHEVTAAPGYADAEACVAEGEFDVVVSDIVLGGKTGIDLLRIIHARRPECPVIIITGDPSVDTASEAVRLGAFDYLPKPVTERDLLRVVRLAIDRSNLTRERDRYAAEVEQARDELHTIFESVAEGIVTVDPSMTVWHANTAAHTILGMDDGAGKHVHLVLPTECAAITRALEGTIESGEPSATSRIEISRVNKGNRVIEFGVAPLVGERGAVLVVRDVTRLSQLEETLEGTQGFHGIIGRSDEMRQIFDLIGDLTDTDSTVLICGESGTGKEEIARVIQQLGPRASGPYIRVNCAALAEDVLESELFGHVKGAFTGALKDRVGRFEAADGGTILLDEIGDVSPKVQLRLLRVLQEREFERVGDTKPILTDVRIIATTNKDLGKKIADGQFRQDLYYRLNVVRIDVPPLRDRMDDLPLLIEHFRRHFNATMNRDVSGFAPEALEILDAHAWPGNVRELENCIERAFVVCREAEIGVRHLPSEIRTGAGHAPSRRATAGSPNVGGRASLSRDEIEAVLNQTDWNVAKSAKKLGIARNTLYLRMKNLGLSRPDDV